MTAINYTRAPLLFKMRKVWRYIEHYGVSQTLAKIRARYHMAATDGFTEPRWNNSACRTPDHKARRIGIMGCGNFAYATIAYFLHQNKKQCLRGVMDINAARAKSLTKHYRAAYATTDAQTIINDPDIDLIYIVSNHASHTPYAVAALDAGKDVHIEKPHVIDHSQLRELQTALQRNPERQCYLGFNRPRSVHFRRLTHEMDTEKDSIMINWFVVGHQLDDDHWYFQDTEGGRILGNLCHWSDMTLEIIGLENAFPYRITPCSQPNAKSDWVTSIDFADGSLATISFSAKGYAFDGIQETLNLQRGNLLAQIRNFKSTAIIRGASRKNFTTRYLDHGHQENVLNSYLGTINQEPHRAVSLQHIIATAEMFLKIKEAHDKQCEIIVQAPDV